MEELNLPILEYAEKMAKTLAILRWDAEVDANDVEFALGSRRQLEDVTQTQLPAAMIGAIPYDSCTREAVDPKPTSQLQDTHTTSLDDTQVWLLDFDCCDTITMDEAGAEKAAIAAHRNNPYHPRPCLTESPDFELWRSFRDRYLAMSATIVQRRALQTRLPDVLRRCRVIRRKRFGSILVGSIVNLAMMMGVECYVCIFYTYLDFTEVHYRWENQRSLESYWFTHSHQTMVL